MKKPYRLPCSRCEVVHVVQWARPPEPGDNFVCDACLAKMDLMMALGTLMWSAPEVSASRAWPVAEREHLVGRYVSWHGLEVPHSMDVALREAMRPN